MAVPVPVVVEVVVLGGGPRAPRGEEVTVGARAGVAVDAAPVAVERFSEQLAIHGPKGTPGLR